jgi:hypothetical protein
MNIGTNACPISFPSALPVVHKKNSRSYDFTSSSCKNMNRKGINKNPDVTYPNYYSTTNSNVQSKVFDHPFSGPTTTKNISIPGKKRRTQSTLTKDTLGPTFPRSVHN